MIRIRMKFAELRMRSICVNDGKRERYLRNAEYIEK